MGISEHVKRMTKAMLELRRMQDKSEAEFISSLGSLSLSQLNILNIVGDIELCTMGEIAKRSSLSLSSVTLIIDKLVRSKLVNRLRSEEDRRIVYAKLATEGKRIYQIQIDHLHMVAHKMLEALSKEEQEVFLQILHKLTLRDTSKE